MQNQKYSDKKKDEKQVPKKKGDGSVFKKILEQKLIEKNIKVPEFISNRNSAKRDTYESG